MGWKRLAETPGVHGKPMKCLVRHFTSQTTFQHHGPFALIVRLGKMSPLICRDTHCLKIQPLVLKACISGLGGLV